MSQDNDSQYDDLIELSDSKLTLNAIESISKSAEVEERYLKKYGSQLYSNILLAITHEKFETNDALVLWKSIKKHQQDLEKKLNRNPGIIVSTLDFLLNVKENLVSPIIIEKEKSDFITDTATKDELTHLYSRNVFDAFMEKSVAEYNRTGKTVALIIFDIDDFKKVNDTYGHQKGDAVLANIGDLLNQEVREMDIAVRYGGEELVVIMNESNSQQAFTFSERVRNKIARSPIDGINVTISAGISQTTPETKTVETVISAADVALYEAKASGKNKSVIKVS